MGERGSLFFRFRSFLGDYGCGSLQSTCLACLRTCGFRAFNPWLLSPAMLDINREIHYGESMCQRNLLTSWQAGSKEKAGRVWDLSLHSKGILPKDQLSSIRLQLLRHLPSPTGIMDWGQSLTAQLFKDHVRSKL